MSKRSTSDEMLGCADYKGVQDVASAHPGSSNVVSNEPRIPVDEVVYRNNLAENGRMQNAVSRAEECCIDEGPCAEVFKT